MRQSNFSNPLQNKACVCISAAIYDRRAIDCTATLPLINSLNHLAYLTSTSPRIREMVCVDGGLERLIRILCQVPRSPSPPPARGVITQDMQAVWKWSLAFQCVVNIGVRGSESVRTRVVEAGMVPVAVRVLESYLKVADALRDERKREAKREEARQRLEQDAETASMSMMVDATTPTVANTRRLVAETTPVSAHAPTLTSLSDAQARDTADQRNRSNTIRQSMITPLENITTSHAENVAPILTTLAPVPTIDSAVSPSSSSSSVLAEESSRPSSSRAEAHRNVQGQHSALGSAGSVEDLSASGSGSDGAEDTEMQMQVDNQSQRRALARRENAGEDARENENRTTPRPPRRALATIPPPVAGHDLEHTNTQVPAQRTANTAQNGADRQRLDRLRPQGPNRLLRERESPINLNDMVYREEEVLLSLQLLAYLSKYAHVRTLFHRDLSTFDALDPLDTLDGELTGSSRQRPSQSWSPTDAPKKNVFCIAERYTLRSSRTGLSQFATSVESHIVPEIQYWAGVIMRNACRKDEKQGGIRQCANMLCGKWEKQPREFAKCRRCRKAKYCSKQCQSKGWQMGHRFWCSARSDDEHPESSKEVAKEQAATDNAESVSADVSQHVPPHDVHPNAEDALMTLNRALPDGFSDAEHVSPTPTENHGIDAVRPGDEPSDLFPTLNAGRQMPEDDLQTAAGGQHNFGQDNRRIPSAIPQHLQGFGASRSRTTSGASSSADVSDVSDDELERASRRVQHPTSSQESSAEVRQTSLTNVMNALDEGPAAGPDRHQSEGSAANRGGRQRTDLAGRPLPPPVIAQHDGASSLNIATDSDLMAMGDNIDATAGNDTEAAVFGRGDFDQMLWRGRTPSMEDQEVTRRLEAAQQREVIDPSFSRPESALAQFGDEGSASEAEANSPGEASQSQTRLRHAPTPSMLNSALLLASNDHVHGPRHPTTGVHAPLPRQQGRFASVGTSSSVSSGLSDFAATSPSSPVYNSHASASDALVGWSNAAVPSTPTAAMPGGAPGHRPSSSVTSTSSQTPRQRPIDVESAFQSVRPDGFRAVQPMSNGVTGLPPLGGAGDLRGLFNAVPDNDVEMGS